MLFDKPVAIFDMDGTLLDSMHCWRLSYKEFLHERNLPLTKTMQHESAEKLFFGKAVQMVLDEYPELGMTREEVLNEFHKIVIRHYSTDILPKQGAIDFLEALHAQGIRIGLATATPKDMAEVVLNRLDLLRLFDFTYFGTKQFSKSQPEYFLRVAQEQGVRPEDCVVFEDALYAMRGAKAAGMSVYAIEDHFALADREEIIKLADRYLHSYSELLNEGE